MKFNKHSSRRKKCNSLAYLVMANEAARSSCNDAPRVRFVHATIPNTIHHHFELISCTFFSCVWTFWFFGGIIDIESCRTDWTFPKKKRLKKMQQVPFDCSVSISNDWKSYIFTWTWDCFIVVVVDGILFDYTSHILGMFHIRALYCILLYITYRFTSRNQMQPHNWNRNHNFHSSNKWCI